MRGDRLLQADVASRRPAYQSAANGEALRTISGHRQTIGAREGISRRHSLGLLAAGVIGGIVGGTFVGGVIANKEAAANFEVVPTTVLPQVASTLAPEQRAQLIEEARRCREPLGWVAIWHSPATKGGTISVTSGPYHSPRFALSTSPRLIALPFPAPYSSGRGVLTLIGEADDLGIALNPQVVAKVSGALPIDVWWTPAGGCP